MGICDWDVWSHNQKWNWYYTHRLTSLKFNGSTDSHFLGFSICIQLELTALLPLVFIHMCSIFILLFSSPEFYSRQKYDNTKRTLRRIFLKNHCLNSSHFIFLCLLWVFVCVCEFSVVIITYIHMYSHILLFYLLSKHCCAFNIYGFNISINFQRVVIPSLLTYCPFCENRLFPLCRITH